MMTVPGANGREVFADEEAIETHDVEIGDDRVVEAGKYSLTKKRLRR